MTLRHKNQETGFTLIELMMTLAIAAIVAAIAVPSFDETIVRNRIITQTNEFIGAVAYTRSEAIKRGVVVELVAKGGDWANGYSVQLESDGTLLMDYSALSGSTTMTPVLGAVEFAFNSRGMLVGDADFIDICHGAAYEGRTIMFTATGMSNVKKKATCL